ncbi:uncharacterized protein (DUF2236 family) [Bradyrhizobium liaoningense]
MPVLMSVLMHGTSVPRVVKSTRESRSFRPPKRGGVVVPLSNDLPADWAGFADYTAAMTQSETLTVSTAAREIATQIFTGARPWLRPPRWYRALTARMLPERLRAGFGFELGARDIRSADNALRWIRRVYPRLPDRLRYVGPYQEAQARLRGETQPDWMTRCLNRAWIGRPQMDVRGK